MRDLTRLKIGDKVTVHRDYGFADSWEQTVVGLDNRYDRNSGEPYPTVILNGGFEFDATTGNAVTPPTGEYIL